MNNTILDEIDNVVVESEMNVLSSLCESYVKTLVILENYEGDSLHELPVNIIQESTDGEEVNTTETKHGVLSKIFSAIVTFFKNIITTIGNFFKKAGNVVKSVIEKFKKLLKSGNNDKAQETLDDENSEENKKIDELNDKYEEKLTPKEEYCDPKETKSDKAKETKSVKAKKKNKATINVKEKYLKTNIQFDQWVKFLEYSDKYLTVFTESSENINIDKFKDAMTSRPTRSLRKNGIGFDRNKKLNIEQQQSSTKDAFDDFFIKISKHNTTDLERPKKIVLFTLFRHKQPISEIINYLENIERLLKTVSKKASDAKEDFDKINVLFKSVDPNKDPKFMQKSAAKIQVLINEITNIGTITLTLSTYLVAELGLYDGLLDVVLPLIKKAEKDANKPVEVDVNIKNKNEE